MLTLRRVCCSRLSEEYRICRWCYTGSAQRYRRRGLGEQFASLPQPSLPLPPLPSTLPPLLLADAVALVADVASAAAIAVTSAAAIVSIAPYLLRKLATRSLHVASQLNGRAKLGRYGRVVATCAYV